MTNEEILQERLQKIRAVIKHFGEENFSLSFSGGKDSTVVHYLLDEALPGNRIPRVYSNTGIEYQIMVDYVKKLQEKDDRIVIIKPRKNIRQTLDRVGYPFKSKEHAMRVWSSIIGREPNTVAKYSNPETAGRQFCCPKSLLYQFEKPYPLDFKISDNCCKQFKEKPLDTWNKVHGIKYAITGVRQSQGGRRLHAQCMSIKSGKLKFFQPIALMTDEWEEWYIQSHNIELCELYTKYHFERTGCRGCPFKIHLQDELNVLRENLPNEYKACEILWRKVYQEYRRIGYRLKKAEKHD